MPDAFVRITPTLKKRAKRRHQSKAVGLTVEPATGRATPSRCGSSLHHPAWLGQFGVIPVLRYRPAAGSSPWFVEGGVGFTLTTTLYQTQHKRFSTHFNFGDHVAAGRNFGPGRSHELALRIEHYSNASIKRPNPGENFIQLRYAYRLH